MGSSHSLLRPRPVSDVGCPKARHEPKALVEDMHTRVLASALHQYVVAAGRPSLRERRLYNGATMAAALKLAMSNDVLQDAVASPTTQEVGRGNEHAGSRDPVILVRNEDVQARLREGLLPNALGLLVGPNGLAHFGRGEERQKRWQVG